MNADTMPSDDATVRDVLVKEMREALEYIDASTFTLDELRALRSVEISDSNWKDGFIPWARELRRALIPFADSKPRKFTAEYGGLGAPMSYVELALLKNVRLFDGADILTDHVWVSPALTEQVRLRKGEEPLKVGDQIQFFARVSYYVKGTRRDQTLRRDLQVGRLTHLWKVRMPKAEVSK